MISEDIIMSQKPYLIRAMYEWMLDLGYTPRLIISPLVRGVVLPDHLLALSQVTLDISPRAVAGLELGNSQIIFEAQFSGNSFRVGLPVQSVAAIIAKEKEVGYVFDIDDHLPQSYSYAVTSQQEASVSSEVEIEEPLVEQQRTSLKRKSAAVSSPSRSENGRKRVRQAEEQSGVQGRRKDRAEKSEATKNTKNTKNTKGSSQKQSQSSSATATKCSKSGRPMRASIRKESAETVGQRPTKRRQKVGFFDGLKNLFDE